MASAGLCASLHLASDTPAPHHSVFYWPDALPAAQPTASKHWRLYCHYRQLRQKILISIHTRTFNGPCAGTTRVNWYQKGKTSLDLNEARDGGVLGCSSLSWTICKQSAPHFRQITTPTVQHLITEFVQAECSSWRQTNSVKALKAQNIDN